MTKKKKPKLHPLLALFKKEVCKKSSAIDPDNQVHWYDLSVGYFIAKGATPKGATPKDAVKLACEARYKHEYWC